MAEQTIYFAVCVFIGFLLGFHSYGFMLYRMHAAARRQRLRKQAEPHQHANAAVGMAALKPRTRPMAVRKEPRHG